MTTGMPEVSSGATGNLVTQCREKKMNKTDETNSGVSRRTFLSSTAVAGTAAIGAGLLVADAVSSPAEAATLTEEQIAALPRVTQEMVAPPFLPKHEQTNSGGPKVVEVRFVIEEKKMVLDDDDAEIWALTFNGSVPGPMIVVQDRKSVV